MLRRMRIVVGVLGSILGLFTNDLMAQKADTTQSVYRVRWGVDIPITAVAFGTNFLGLQLVNEKPEFTLEEIAALDPNDVNSFDRGATRQDPDFADQAQVISDIGMNVSFALPGLLMLDRKIRPDGWRLLVLYLETEAIVGNVYSYGGALWVDRTRPFLYNPDFDLDPKLETGTRNSFYSGHTASTACATFFMAKVFTDYHPELGSKKWMYYGLALAPPAFVGFMRYKAAKHFPSDILIGATVGAATGILIPQLHKRTAKGRDVGMIPQMGNVWGLSAYYAY